ncbi:hypothetical protein VSDG_05193 [Cytospora chrysosperma]|uniref:Heterokaryon incompatibility domain-containing protein n=1 Tax=Cytospora chrysosperma TaxID=252740 RepID=A0A423VXR8_CYTCH|nr:hypothetical protein VSDG_05193 [Valsa sordida]
MDCKAPSDKLCDICREFNPSKGKFVTNYGTLGSLPGFLDAEYDATGLESWRLGFLDEIYRRRSSCSFCWLIFSVTHSSVGGNIGYDGVDKDGGRVSCHLEWQLDGRLLDEGHTLTTNAITRRLRVFNPKGLFADGQVMLLEYVELYSGRKLSFWSDRLIAFAGLASVLCPPLKATLFFGLPHSHFDFALLWDRKSPGARIVTTRGAEFPSWSWCGWEGASTWRIYMVSSSLLNLHDWLKHHTWIVWYASWDINVESGEGKEAGLYDLQERSWGLALVWRKSANNTDVHPERWHGYASTCELPYGRSIPPSSTETLPTRPTSANLKHHLLYFWTWTAFFQLSRKSLSSREFSSSLEPGLHRFGIGDIKGDWCGTIVLEEKWFNQVGGIFEFVAISEARDFSMEELDTWNYYIPEDREISEWYVFYALMIVWNETHTIAERVGLAKIYQKAFHTGSFQPGKAWREIVLG